MGHCIQSRVTEPEVNDARGVSHDKGSTAIQFYCIIKPRRRRYCKTREKDMEAFENDASTTVLEGNVKHESYDFVGSLACLVLRIGKSRIGSLGCSGNALYDIEA